MKAALRHWFGKKKVSENSDNSNTNLTSTQSEVQEYSEQTPNTTSSENISTPNSTPTSSSEFNETQMNICNESPMQTADTIEGTLQYSMWKDITVRVAKSFANNNSDNISSLSKKRKLEDDPIDNSFQYTVNTSGSNVTSEQPNVTQASDKILNIRIPESQLRYTFEQIAAEAIYEYQREQAKFQKLNHQSSPNSNSYLYSQPTSSTNEENNITDSYKMTDDITQSDISVPLIYPDLHQHHPLYFQDTSSTNTNTNTTDTTNTGNTDNLSVSVSTDTSNVISQDTITNAISTSTSLTNEEILPMCPICKSTFTISINEELNSHVLQCLDNQNKDNMNSQEIQNNNTEVNFKFAEQELELLSKRKMQEESDRLLAEIVQEEENNRSVR